MRKRSLRVLLFVFVILAAFSGLFMYRAHLMPTEEVRTVSVLTYSQTGRYDCTVKFRPDLLYHEATLTPEGGLFDARLVERADVTFTYDFAISKPANVTVTYELNTTVASPAGWTRTNITAPGYVLSFDGVDDYVNVPAAQSIAPPSDPTTVIIRVKPTRLGSSWSGIIDQGRDFRDNFWLMESAIENRYVFGLGNGGDYWEQVTPSLSLNTWYQLTLVFSSTNVTLYVDGSYVNSWSHGLTWQRTWRPLVIGCLDDLTGFGKADVDEVRIYRRSLSASEIAQDKSGVTSRDGLALWLRFDGNAEDGSGYGNHGTIYGAMWTLDGSVYAGPGGSPLYFTGTAARSTLSLNLNLASYAALARRANAEVGAAVQDYTLFIRPQIRAVAEAGGRRIEESFKPVLEFKTQYRTEKSDVLTVGGLEHVGEETLNVTEVVSHLDVVAQRYASYAFLAASLFALVYTAWLYSRTEVKAPAVEAEVRPPKVVDEVKAPRVAEVKPARVVAEVKAPEDVADLEEKPTQQGGTTVVGVMSFEDLLKIANKLGKPLQSEEVPPAEREGDVTRVFYVVDGSVVYQYPGWLISRFSREASK